MSHQVDNNSNTVQCWSQATWSRSQDPPRPAVPLGPADLCGGGGSGVIRVRPAEYMSLQQTKIRPCGVRAVHRNGGAGL